MKHIIIKVLLKINLFNQGLLYQKFLDMMKQFIASTKPLK